MLRSGMSDYIINTPGNVKMREVTAEENIKRSNYRIADNIDYLDGDLKSSPDYPGDPASSSKIAQYNTCLLYTSPSPRDPIGSRMPSSA